LADSLNDFVETDKLIWSGFGKPSGDRPRMIYSVTSAPGPISAGLKHSREQVARSTRPVKPVTRPYGRLALERDFMDRKNAEFEIRGVNHAPMTATGVRDEAPMMPAAISALEARR
jgi:hypothetical protein